MSKNWQPKMDNFGGKTHGDFHKRLEAAIEEELPSDVGGIKLHVRIVAQVGSSPWRCFDAGFSLKVTGFHLLSYIRMAVCV